MKMAKEYLEGEGYVVSRALLAVAGDGHVRAKLQRQGSSPSLLLPLRERIALCQASARDLGCEWLEAEKGGSAMEAIERAVMGRNVLRVVVVGEDRYKGRGKKGRMVICVSRSGGSAKGKSRGSSSNVHLEAVAAPTSSTLVREKARERGGLRWLVEHGHVTPSVAEALGERWK